MLPQIRRYMRVEKFFTVHGQERYLVVDSKIEPVQVINRFLKFKDNAGKARNTLRAYAYQLSLYFEYLEQKGLDYREVTLEDIAGYMRWLQKPMRQDGIIEMMKSGRALRNATINTYVSTVTEFYSYLMRIDDDKNRLSEKLKIQLSNSKRGYKDFLYHVNKGKSFEGRYLKLREEKIEKRVLEQNEVEQLVDACRNGRDAFLLTLLYETGFRIGECLALWLEDVDVMASTITIVDRGYLTNNAEIKTVTSERTINVSEGLINCFLSYVADYHDETIETNFIFFKIEGKHQGEPLDYQCVDALFKKLRKRTGIYVTPHSFRHTHFDKLRTEGWGFEKIQKRGGWANVQTPMSTYSHPSDEEIRNEWNRVEENFKINGGDNTE